jgi:hypothetical protein
VKIATYRKQLIAVHRSQKRMIEKSTRAIQKKFGKMAEAKDFISTISRLTELFNQQTAAAEALFAVAVTLPDGNHSPALMETYGQDASIFLTSTRLLAEHLGGMDKQNKGMACSSNFTETARTVGGSDKKESDRADKLSKLLCAAQSQIDSLIRQTRSITSTQEALFRSYGLKVFQGHKRREDNKRSA